MQTWKRDVMRPARRGPFKTVILFLISIVTLLLQACGGGGTVTTPLVNIRITPATSLLPLSGVRQLKATGTYGDGSTLDITQQVTWSSSGTSGGTNVIAVSPAGIASGTALGSGVVSATLGPVVGLLPLIVSTNGYSSSTVGIVAAPFNKTQVDIGYLPISQFKNPGGLYAVQAVNLDGDQFSTVLPVQTALVAAIAMPAGFVPNATAASQTSLKVAVISYTSPNVLVIDASNDPTDLASNTIVGTFTAPVSKSVTFGSKQCMICAALVNPANDQLLLSTAQGYYSMDLTAGTFTALSLNPPAFPAPSFTLNPVAADPYIVSPTFGQDPNFASEVQTINLTTSVVTSNTTVGLTSANSATLNLFGNNGAIVDTGSNAQALWDLTDPQHPSSTLVTNLTVCPPPGPQLFDMTAVGVAAGVDPTTVTPVLFLSQHSGSCVGLELWPPTNTGLPLDPINITYGYGPMPDTPDGSTFVNGSDANTIATFNSVVDKKNYGLLVSANQTWVAKINLLSVASAVNNFNGFFLPNGVEIPAAVLHAGVGGDPVIYLPTTGTISLSTNSIDFGGQTVGTASVPSSLTLTNTAATAIIPQIAIAGTNAGDFTQTNDCQNVPAQGACTITVTFTPSAQGPRTATLTVNGGGSVVPLSVTLAGSGS